MSTGQEKSVVTQWEEIAHRHGEALLEFDRARRNGGSQYESAIGRLVRTREEIDRFCRDLARARPAGSGK